MKECTLSTEQKKKVALSLFGYLFLTAVWWVISVFVNNSTLLPSPLETAKKLFELAGESVFWKTVSLSFLRVIAGFAVGAVSGAFIGLISRSSKIIEAVTSPIMLIIKTTPVASVIILLYIWLKKETIPSFISVLIVAPIFCKNAAEAMNSVDGKLLEVAKIFEMSPSAKLKAIFLPAFRSYLIAAFSTSLGYAFKAGIAAEIICQPKFSIGSMIYDGKVYLDTESIFAWTVVVILLSLLFENAFTLLIRRLSK